VGALGQPHRAWEGFHPDPNPFSLTVQTKSQITVS
jgi:hypothetical protein